MKYNMRNTTRLQDKMQLRVEALYNHLRDGIEFDELPDQHLRTPYYFILRQVFWSPENQLTSELNHEI